MKTSQYVKEALSTECDYGPVLLRVAKDPQLLRLLHALLLLSTEANELLNNFKAHLFYGKPLDLVNVDEECGDILWALAVLADFRGYRTLIQFQNKNIAKLKKRYPNKFTEEAAQVRDLEMERAVLEGSPSPTYCEHEPQHSDLESSFCKRCGVAIKKKEVHDGQIIWITAK